jgi:hypothetical protein
MDIQESGFYRDGSWVTGIYRDGSWKDERLIPIHLETPIMELVDYFTNTVLHGCNELNFIFRIDPEKPVSGYSDEYFRLVAYSDGTKRVVRKADTVTYAVFIDGQWHHLVDNYYSLSKDETLSLFKMFSK